MEAIAEACGCLKLAWAQGRRRQIAPLHRLYPASHRSGQRREVQAAPSLVARIENGSVACNSPRYGVKPGRPDSGATGARRDGQRRLIERHLALGDPRRDELREQAEAV